MNRERGTVKWFSREKGWGFLRRENGDEIFVHHSDIEGEGHVSLVDDEEVEFGVEEMEKGPRAREVRRPGQAPAAKSAQSTQTTASATAPEGRSERDGGRGSSRGRGERAETAPAGGNRQEAAARQPEKSTTAPTRGDDDDSGGGRSGGGKDGGPPPLDRGLRQRLGDRFPIFRDR